MSRSPKDGSMSSEGISRFGIEKHLTDGNNK